MSDNGRGELERVDIAAPAQAVEHMVASGDRRVDRAWALAAIGGFFLLPATAAVFAAPFKLFGLPVLWVYLFGVWLFLICGAALISFGRASRTPPRYDAGAVERSER